MSAPFILNCRPAANEAGVELGRPVEIFFDQPMDPLSVTSATFSLIGPGGTSVLDASGLLHRDPKPLTAKEYVPGVFSWPAPDHVVFTPARPLRPNSQHTVLLVGKNSTLVSQYAASSAGEGLTASLQYTFQTGVVNAPVLPAVSPQTPTLPWQRPRLSPTAISVRLLPSDGSTDRKVVLTFPCSIDPDFDPSGILIAAEPLLNDPQTPVPADVTTEIRITNNIMEITLHNIESPA